VVLTYRESGHPNYIEFAKDLRETPADGPFGVLIINARLLYGPGTPAGDALLISDNRIKGEHRFEAAKRFARRHLRLSLANPRAQSALRRLIAEDHFAKRRLIETTLPGLIWEVADSCHRYQNVRLGHSWKTSTRGKRKKIRPAVDLNPWDYLQWIRQRVYARLTDTICKEELAEEVPAYDISLLRLSESNTELPEGDLLDDQFSKLTKSERRYAQKLWAALEEGNDLKQARKITRRSLRIRANHERVLFFRTRHRGTAKRPQLN
jgi:hypothetical protein